MAISLEVILRHETFRAADPVLRAGEDAAAGAQVRWVHSSEVMDIAPLLSGGELLLTGGFELAAADPQQLRRYVMDLAARKVSALAVESGGPLPELPTDLVRSAQEAGLPLIELRKVAPFVQIAQAINSMLVSQSVALLQRADVLSHELAAELANGSGLKQLIGLLAQKIPAEVTVLDRTGFAFEKASVDDSLLGPRSSQVAPIDIDISQRGTVTAALRINVGSAGDRAWAQVAGERAASILALALHERHSPTLSDVASRELVRSVSAGVQGPRLAQLCSAAGLDPLARFVVIVAHPDGPGHRWSAVEQLIRRSLTPVVTYVDHHEMLAIVGLPAMEARSRRIALISELREGLAGKALIGAVGPMSSGIDGASRSMAEARLTFDLVYAKPEPGSVLDAEAYSLERLFSRQVDDSAARHFVFEVVGEVLEHDAARGSRLLETLDVWLSSGCNTAETARVLHLERQSMHNRLQRIFSLVGGDPRGSDRLAGFHVAARLARRSLAAPPG